MKRKLNVRQIKFMVEISDYNTGTYISYLSDNNKIKYDEKIPKNPIEIVRQRLTDYHFDYTTNTYIDNKKYGFMRLTKIPIFPNKLKLKKEE